jgi:DNA-binding transcriptional ArsR family regulator
MKTAVSHQILLIRKSAGSNEQVKLDYVALKNAAMTLRAMNHKLRQQIVKLLEENKRMNVTDIYVKLRLEQSVASQHLAILRRANILITERDGKFIHYSLNHDRLAALEKFVHEFTDTDQITDISDAYSNSDMLHKFYLLSELETKGYEKALLYKTDEDLEFLRSIKSDDPKEVQKKLEAQLYSK